MHTRELDRLAAWLRTAARDDGLIETAQVRVLGLDEVRVAAGSRWPRMRERVREGSIKIIAARIGPDDAVIPCGDGFLVVFAEGSPERMQRCCSDIHDALIAFYLGEETLAALRAEVHRETASAESLACIASKTSASHRTSQQRMNLGRYWPTWSKRHQFIVAYLCAPVIGDHGAALRLGYAPDFLETGIHRARDFLDLDLCLLEQACAAAEQSDAPPLGVSVHATTMQCRKSRMLYLDHVLANASSVQQRMFITVAEIEPGTPLIALTEWSGALRRVFTRVALDFHHSDRALSAIASTGAWAAGYHLPIQGSESGVQLQAVLSQLDRNCRMLQRQGVRPFINGFLQTGFLELAAYSEFAFATGAVWPSQQSLPAALADTKITV